MRSFCAHTVDFVWWVGDQFTDTPACTTCSEVCKTDLRVDFYSWACIEPGDKLV